MIGRVTEPSKATHDARFPASETVSDEQKSKNLSEMHNYHVGCGT